MVTTTSPGVMWSHWQLLRLLEGREQTLNHIRTPNRFELVLDEPVIIGMRQATNGTGSKVCQAYPVVSYMAIP